MGEGLWVTWHCKIKGNGKGLYFIRACVRMKWPLVSGWNGHYFPILHKIYRKEYNRWGKFVELHKDAFMLNLCVHLWTLDSLLNVNWDFKGASFFGWVPILVGRPSEFKSCCFISLTVPILYSHNIISLSSLFPLYSAVCYLLLMVDEITSFFNSHPFSVLITGCYSLTLYQAILTFFFFTNFFFCQSVTQHLL